jgi:hypothetical protein
VHTTGAISRGDYVFVVALNICGSSVWNVVHVTLLVARILRWPLDLQKICVRVLYNFVGALLFEVVFMLPPLELNINISLLI